MKNRYNLLVGIALFLTLSCVQKSYDRTIIFKLKIPNASVSDNIGIRGNDQPFNWNADYPMKFDPKDSTFYTTATMNTGYFFTEFKFVKNGDFEFKDSENRKLTFDNQDTIIYNATFDRR